MPELDLDRLRVLLRYARRVYYAGLVVAFAMYFLAYWMWTQGQNLPAIVIAGMGFLLFRNIRKLAFNLLLNRFGNDPRFNLLLERLDPITLARGEMAALEQLQTRGDANNDQ